MRCHLMNMDDWLDWPNDGDKRNNDYDRVHVHETLWLYSTV